METKLIIGLGNPGENYKLTRHNVGFMLIDKLLEKANLTLDEKTSKGLYTKYKLNNTTQIILAKPTTFMNLSGEFLLEIIQFYKIDIKNIIVIFDDMDCPLGQWKYKTTGSSGGHNGIKDIIRVLSTQNFQRIKIGIGRPENKQKIVNYVLNQFSKQEFDIITNILDQVSDVILKWDNDKTINDLISCKKKGEKYD